MDGAWGETPYDRIEDVRIGWPSLGHLANGFEFALSHGSTGGLVFATRDAVGSGAWTTTTLPALLDADGNDIWHLWPRAAVGGADGNTIHAICISAPEGNGGVLLNGQDGAMIYMRSTDGGANWDMQTFAELDTASFAGGFVADSYAIHAEGDKVAFAVFGGFDDTFAMISEDNGETGPTRPSSTSRSTTTSPTPVPCSTRDRRRHRRQRQCHVLQHRPRRRRPRR